jgi:Tfp pilus assembly protein PilF
LGSSDYFAYAIADRDKKNPSKQMLVEADTAFSNLLKLAPQYELAILYRARIAKLMDSDPPTGLAAPFYQQYVQLVTVTKPEKATTPSVVRGLIESYNNLGALSIATDKEKAKEYFNKTLALDPANANAKDNLNYLNGPVAPAAPVKKAPIK